MPRARAGEVVGQFWSGMFVAQLFVAWWVLKMGVQRLVIIGSLTTMLCSVPLWLYGDIDGLIILAFIWGVANLGLLKIIISFATLMVRVPTPRLISGLLLGATLGTAVSPWVTSQIFERSSSYFVFAIRSRLLPGAGDCLASNEPWICCFTGFLHCAKRRCRRSKP